MKEQKNMKEQKYIIISFVYIFFFARNNHYVKLYKDS